MAIFAADGFPIVHEIMMDDRCGDDGKPITPSKVRLDAAIYLLDQFIGKAKTSVDLSSSSPMEDLMASILLNPDGAHSHWIIEGSLLVEDDAEDGDRPICLRD
jgi:hypothetical protein